MISSCQVQHRRILTLLKYTHSELPPFLTDTITQNLFFSQYMKNTNKCTFKYHTLGKQSLLCVLHFSDLPITQSKKSCVNVIWCHYHCKILPKTAATYTKRVWEAPLRVLPLSPPSPSCCMSCLSSGQGSAHTRKRKYVQLTEKHLWWWVEELQLHFESEVPGGVGGVGGVPVCCPRAFSGSTFQQEKQGLPGKYPKMPSC